MIDLSEIPARLPCLTLWPEWIVGVVHYGKDIENRSWTTPERLIGKWVGFHGGKTIGGGMFPSQKDAIEPMLATASHAGIRFGDKAYLDLHGQQWFDLMRSTLHQATAVSSRIACLVRLGKPVPKSPDRAGMNRWHDVSQHGWTITDRVVLSRPVLHRGAQGIWLASEEATADIKAQIEKMTEQGLKK